VPKRPVISSQHHHGEILTGPDVHALVEEAVERAFDAKLPPLIQEIHELKLQLSMRRIRPRPLDPRKKFIAEIISKRPPIPKMSVVEILHEADDRQERLPREEHRKPVPEWGVRSWSDMKGKNKAQKYISDIRSDPRYLPFEYLTPCGKKRAQINHEDDYRVVTREAALRIAPEAFYTTGL
jgi:hypothetical protein